MPVMASSHGLGNDIHHSESISRRKHLGLIEWAKIMRREIYKPIDRPGDKQKPFANFKQHEWSEAKLTWLVARCCWARPHIRQRVKHPEIVNREAPKHKYSCAECHHLLPQPRAGSAYLTYGRLSCYLNTFAAYLPQGGSRCSCRDRKCACRQSHREASDHQRTI